MHSKAYSVTSKIRKKKREAKMPKETVHADKEFVKSDEWRIIWRKNE